MIKLNDAGAVVPLNKSILRDNYLLLLHGIIYAALGYSTLTENGIFTTGLYIAIIIYYLFLQPINQFYFLVGFVPFENVMKIASIDVYFILLMISIIKLIYINRDKKVYKISGLIFFVALFNIEMIGDIGAISIGKLTIILTTIAYLYFFSQLSDLTSYRIVTAILHYVISYIIVIFTTIMSYGSVLSFIQLVGADSQLYRFGETVDSLGEEARLLGGAMGIPLYSAMLISMLLSYYISNNTIKIGNKVLIITFCYAGVLFGLLTISRSFLLCMITCFLFLLLSVFTRNWRKITKALIIIFITSILLYVAQADLINSKLADFAYRETQDYGFGIRSLIYQDCFQYLEENRMGYLFGFGISNYGKIGNQNNLMFSYLAHNLYLDIIMSVGILGGMCFVGLFNMLRKRAKACFRSKASLISVLPLLVFLVFGLTALSLTNLKTWIYIVMLIINVYAVGKSVAIQDGGRNGE